jgi:hypothetical protein
MQSGVATSPADATSAAPWRRLIQEITQALNELRRQFGLLHGTTASDYWRLVPVAAKRSGLL